MSTPSADATAEEYLQSCEFPGFNHADILAAYRMGARSGRDHSPSDALIERSADAYVKSIAPKRGDARAARRDDAAGREREWKDLVFAIGEKVGCLASTFPDGNAHILRAIDVLAARSATHGSEPHE